MLSRHSASVSNDVATLLLKPFFFPFALKRNSQNLGFSVCISTSLVSSSIGYSSLHHEL